MSDRLAVFNGGRIEQVGSPAEVYENPATRVRGRLRRDVEPALGRRGAGHRRGRGDVHRPAREDPSRRPGEQPSPAQCAVNGTVREVVYLGVNTRYIVSLDAGGELVVVQQNQATSSMQALAARGRQVRLIWDREHNRARRGVRFEHRVGGDLEHEEELDGTCRGATASLAVAAGCGGGRGERQLRAAAGAA